MWATRNLLSLHPFVGQLPKYSEILTIVALKEPQKRNFNIHGFLTQASTTKTDEQKTKKLQQKITLIAQNQAMSITTLEEAQKLAKRRDLHLLRMNQTDAKTGRIMFKLVQRKGNSLSRSGTIMNSLYSIAEWYPLQKC